MNILPKIYPKSPDPYLVRLGGDKSQAALARLAHLNPLIEQINYLTQLVDSSATGITAYAGGGQTNATELLAAFNEVTVVASALDSVRLESAAAGMRQTVKNEGANVLAIYPASGEVIDDQAANDYVTLGPGASVTFRPISDTAWETTAESTGINNALYVDATFGDNNTAVKENPARPYATIAAAITAASAGDVVIVNPGTYTVSFNLVKDGVDIHCLPQVVLNFTGATPMFNADTTAGGTTLTTPWYLTGYPEITGGALTYMVGIRTNPNASMFMQLGHVTWANNSNTFILRDGKIVVDCNGNISGAGGGIRVQDTANAYFYVNGVIETTQVGAAATTININAGFNFSGELVVEANDVKCASTVGLANPIFLMGMIAGSNVSIKLRKVTDAIASSNPYIWVYPGGGSTTSTVNIEIEDLQLTQRRLIDAHHSNTYLTVKQGTAPNLVVDDTAALTIGESNISTSAISTVAGGNLYIANSTINSGSGVGLNTFNVSDGVFTSIGSIIITDLTAAASVAQSATGNVFLIGTVLTVHPTGVINGSYYVSGDGNVLAGPTATAAGSAQALVGPGAVNLTTAVTLLETTGADAYTLADGLFDGQEKTIILGIRVGDATLTPTNGQGFTTVTFNSEGDSVVLRWSTPIGAWNVVGSYGSVIA